MLASYGVCTGAGLAAWPRAFDSGGQLLCGDAITPCNASGAAAAAALASAAYNASSSSALPEPGLLAGAVVAAAAGAAAIGMAAALRRRIGRTLAGCVRWRRVKEESRKQTGVMARKPLLVTQALPEPLSPPYPLYCSFAFQCLA